MAVTGGLLSKKNVRAGAPIAAADEYCFEATACLKTFFVLFFFFFQSCDEPSSQLLQLAGREKALIT
jgi:hypothetical protein